jgi:voltage-gated potassium channel Kch
MTVGGWQGMFFAGAVEPSSSYMYFSLTTITTVGYGDLTAQTHLGRLLANSEAVVGQVYLVTFVAMIVGLRAQEWRDRGGRLTPPPDSPEVVD